MKKTVWKLRNGASIEFSGKTGPEYRSGDTTGARWCDGCQQHHGPLYRCPKYEPETRAKVEQANRDFEEWLVEYRASRVLAASTVPRPR